MLRKFVVNIVDHTNQFQMTRSIRWVIYLWGTVLSSVWSNPAVLLGTSVVYSEAIIAFYCTPWLLFLCSVYSFLMKYPGYPFLLGIVKNISFCILFSIDLHRVLALGNRNDMQDLSMLFGLLSGPYGFFRYTDVCNGPLHVLSAQSEPSVFCPSPTSWSHWYLRKRCLLCTCSWYVSVWWLWRYHPKTWSKFSTEPSVF